MPVGFKRFPPLLMLLGRLEIFRPIQIFLLLKSVGDKPSYVSQDLHIRKLAIFLTAHVAGAAAQSRVRIAGLEGNAEYMSLLNQGCAVADSRDSIVNAKSDAPVKVA